MLTVARTQASAESFILSVAIQRKTSNQSNWVLNKLKTLSKSDKMCFNRGVLLNPAECHLQDELMQVDDSRKDTSLSALTPYERQKVIHKAVEMISPVLDKMNLHVLLLSVRTMESIIYQRAPSKVVYFSLLTRHISIGKKIMEDLPNRPKLSNGNGM